MKNSFLLTGALAMLLVFGTAGRSSAQDDDGPMSDLKFVVVRDYNGKPVRNAAVVLHPVNRKGKQSRGGLELKTDGEGRTNIDGVPDFRGRLPDRQARVGDYGEAEASG
jgi:hypothetical protein